MTDALSKHGLLARNSPKDRQQPCLGLWDSADNRTGNPSETPTPYLWASSKLPAKAPAPDQHLVSLFHNRKQLLWLGGGGGSSEKKEGNTIHNFSVSAELKVEIAGGVQTGNSESLWEYYPPLKEWLEIKATGFKLHIALILNNGFR